MVKWRGEIAEIDEKAPRLTDLYVEQDIERDAYLQRKRALMSERRSAEEQIGRLERDATAWLQPPPEGIQHTKKPNKKHQKKQKNHTPHQQTPPPKIPPPPPPPHPPRAPRAARLKTNGLRLAKSIGKIQTWI